MEKNCLQCKKVFQKPTTRSKRDFLERCKFCSKKCYNESMTGVPLSEDRKALLRGRIAHNKKPLTIYNCANCSALVEKLTSTVHKKSKTRFCSHKCASQYKDQGKTQLQKKLRQRTDYKNWRISVFKRDNFTCKECGQRGGELNADHIKPFAFFPELRLNIDNGRTLCVSCHKNTNTWGGRATQLFKETLWANAV